MGHKNGKSFAWYVGVMDDTQSAFMGTPSRHTLMNLACNASLTRDASAPNALTGEQKRSIELDPGLVDLKEETEKLRRAIHKDFKQLELAKQAEDPRYRQLRRLQTSIRTHRKRLYNSKKKEVRSDFFDNIGNAIIAANREGKPITFTADVSHIQPERKELADLEFKNRETDDLTPETLLEDRIRSLELRLQLGKLHMPRGLHGKIDFEKSETDRFAVIKIEEPCHTHWKSETGLECPVCIGTPELDPAARMFNYSRKDALLRHFGGHRLPFFFRPGGRRCDIPSCTFTCPSLNGYKVHLKKRHCISL